MVRRIIYSRDYLIKETPPEPWDQLVDKVANTSALGTDDIDYVDCLKLIYVIMKEIRSLQRQIKSLEQELGYRKIQIEP